MTALCIILGIILLFVLLISIPVVLHLEYTDAVKCSVSWLFLKFTIYPFKKKEKSENKNNEKNEQPKKQDEKKESTPKPKKENFIKTFYNYQGISGVIELINNCVEILKKFTKGFLKSIIIKNFMLHISVTESDAAKTAIKYGKICSALYPSLGFISSNMKVKNYDVNVYADYCGERTKCDFLTDVAFIPRSIINAGIAFAFRILAQLLKVVISNIKSANNNSKGGIEQ